MDFRAAAPAGWNAHWDSMPNSVRALFVTFKLTAFPFDKKEVQIEAWGQLCFDDVAARHAANYMWHHGMRMGWTYLSWRAEMDGPCIGNEAKTSGSAPSDFSMETYRQL